MDIDTPPHLDNPLPAADGAENLDKENGVTGAGTEVPTEGDMTTVDDVDMDANPNGASLGTKELGNGKTGAGIVSGKAGGNASADGRASGVGVNRKKPSLQKSRTFSSRDRKSVLRAQRERQMERQRARKSRHPRRSIFPVERGYLGACACTHNQLPD